MDTPSVIIVFMSGNVRRIIVQCVELQSNQSIQSRYIDFFLDYLCIFHFRCWWWYQVKIVKLILFRLEINLYRKFGFQHFVKKCGLIRSRIGFPSLIQNPLHESYRFKAISGRYHNLNSLLARNIHYSYSPHVKKKNLVVG